MSLAWVARQELASTLLTPLLFGLIPAAICTRIASTLPPRWMGPRGLELLAVLLAAFLLASVVAWVSLRTRRWTSLLITLSGVLIGTGATAGYLGAEGLNAGEF